MPSQRSAKDDDRLKMCGPGGFLRQGRVLGGESKTIADGGVAKLTLEIFTAKNMPLLICLGFVLERLNAVALHLVPDAGAGYAQLPSRLGLVAAAGLQGSHQAHAL
jgi:hypothetical protein